MTGHLRAVCGVLVLAGVLGAVHGADGVLGSLPGPSPSAWSAWLDLHSPISASMAFARAVGLGLGWYLVVVSALRAAGRSLGALRLVRIADRLTARRFGGLVRAVVGVAVAGAVTTAPLTVATSAAVAAPPGVIGTILDGSGNGSGVGPADVAPTRGQAPGVDGSGDRATTQHPVLGAWRDPAGTTAATAASVEGEEYDEYVVRSGDSFWRISDEIVSARLARPATDAEIAEHWRRFVALNGDRLVVPGEPDLIVEGQRLLLPSERDS